MTTYTSGRAFCAEKTAEILFPKRQITLCQVRETDFGIFEGKNADDLLGDKDYEAWLETGCMGKIPKGDDVCQFKNQCCEKFLTIVKEVEAKTAVNTKKNRRHFLHGGNIMSVLERFAVYRALDRRFDFFS